MTENTSLDGIHGFLYSLYLQGKNETEAHEQLLKALGEDSFDLNLVADFYSRIQIGEYKFGMNSLKEQIDLINEESDEEINPRHLLARLPPHIQTDIVKKLEMNARSMLRVASSQFKDVVDSTEYKIRHLLVESDSEILKFFDNRREVNMKYEDISIGCVVHQRSGNAIIKRGEYHDIVRDEMKSVLRIPNLKIANFKIFETTMNVASESYASALDILQTVLSSLEPKLHVETLYMDIENIHDLKSILAELQPRALKNISLGQDEGESYLISINEISELPQWRNAKRFGSCLRIDDANFVEHFSHFNFVEIRLATKITTDMLINLKDALLSRSRTLNQMRIFIWELEDDINVIKKKLEPSPPFKGQEAGWIHFKYPNSEDKLFLSVEEDFICFRGPHFAFE